MFLLLETGATAFPRKEALCLDVEGCCFMAESIYESFEALLKDRLSSALDVWFVRWGVCILTKLLKLPILAPRPTFG